MPNHLLCRYPAPPRLNCVCRWFLDKLATHIMAFEGDSKVHWFEGGYSDYEEDRKRRGLGSSAPTRVKFRKLAS